MTFLKVMAFSLAVLLVYTGFANILPQVQSDPPTEETVATGSLDMAGMIAYGERLFSGKGTCTLCHNDMGRAPDLLAIDLSAEFRERLEDPAYQGAAAGEEGPQAVETYLRESLDEPSAYVVAGFGKKGTDDKVSPMPVVTAPPIELSAVQVDAIVAFLQDRAGLAPTVPLPSAEDAADASPPSASEDGGDGAEPPAPDAVSAIDKYMCAACHDLEGSEADVGPDLHGISARMSRAEVMEAILYPNETIAPGYDADLMPADFAEQMHASELAMIADHLMALPARGGEER